MDLYGHLTFIENLWFSHNSNFLCIFVLYD